MRMAASNVAHVTVHLAYLDAHSEGQNRLEELMQLGEPTIVLRLGGAGSAYPWPLPRVERFATSLGMPMIYIQAHVMRLVLRPHANVRAMLDADLAETRKTCHHHGMATASTVAAMHVRASDAHTDGRGAVPAAEYAEALASVLHRDRRVGDGPAAPLCVFIASDVASINASHFEATSRHVGWTYVSSERALLAPGLEVAKMVHGNMSRVLEKTGQVPPMKLGIEAIMDLFQLVSSDFYVASYSNWAFVVLAMRLSASSDPSDPSDRYHRSVVVMNGNPSIPDDPYEAKKIRTSGTAGRVPALHAFHDARALFQHLLMFTHWIGG